MKCMQINFSDKHPNAHLAAWIGEDAEILKMPPRRAIIVCPGGGYRGHAAREGEPIARKFFGEGFNVFQLHYSVGENASHFTPMIELALAIRYIREHANELNIAPDQIFVIGFSAGGHLAASSSILWDHPIIRAAVGVGSGECAVGINRPTGVILCYPVIMSGEYSHKGSFDRLCGSPDAPEIEREIFSLERYVSPTAVPVFVWHTVADKTVPVQNSIELVQAMIMKGIPVEAHIYPSGRHGLSLATKETWSEQPERLVPHLQGWFDAALRWIDDFHTICQ